MFPFALDRKTEASGTYPIVLVSYLLACTQYGSSGEAALVKSYLEYVISPEGQEAAQENAGSSPLSAGLREKIEPAVEAIETGS
jgi:phosphate transport system substrate-binding protein